MPLPSGHTNCHFSLMNRYTTASFVLAKALIIEYALKGWKVGIEQDTKTLEYTVYWGA